MGSRAGAAPSARTEGRGGAPDEETLRQVMELNLRGLQLLRAGLEAPTAAGPPLPLAVLGQPEAWRALDAPALRRLAHCPWLLFGAQFDDVSRWRSALAARVQDDAAVDAAAACSVAGAGDAAASGGGWPAFRRLVLHYAWHLARAAPLSAALVLGMPAETAALLRTQGLHVVDALGAQAGEWVRLRWEQRPSAWAALLQAARSGDEAALRVAQLHGLQRIAGACRAAAGGGGSL